MNVLLLGANGQLGWELTRTCPEHIDIDTCDFPKVDFGSEQSLLNCIEASSARCIINAAAYTAVDQAETEPELAFRINRDAVATLARHAMQKQIRLAHISTDFIFDGQNHRPYRPDDPPAPQSVYGQSKLEGEQAIRQILGDDALIIRTAWLYSSHGQNFVRTMIKLMQTKPGLTVIDEQIGSPTWAHGLAHAVWAAIEKNVTGTYHWTDAGVASWYDFAMAIQEEALSLNLLDQPVPIKPVPTTEYPTPAARPFYSVLDKSSFLDKTGLASTHWRTQLRSMLQELL